MPASFWKCHSNRSVLLIDNVSLMKRPKVYLYHPLPFVEGRKDNSRHTHTHTPSLDKAPITYILYLFAIVFFCTHSTPFNWSLFNKTKKMFKGGLNVRGWSSRTGTAPTTKPVEPTQVDIGTQTRRSTNTGRSPSPVHSESDPAPKAVSAEAAALKAAADARMAKVRELAKEIDDTYAGIKVFYCYGVALKTNITRAYNDVLAVSPKDLPPVPKGAMNGVTKYTPDWNFANSLDDLVVEVNEMVSIIHNAWRDIQKLHKNIHSCLYLPHTPDDFPDDRIKRYEEWCSRADTKAGSFIIRANGLEPELDILMPTLKVMKLDWERSDGLM